MKTVVLLYETCCISGTNKGFIQLNKKAVIAADFYDFYKSAAIT